MNFTTTTDSTELALNDNALPPNGRIAQPAKGATKVDAGLLALVVKRAQELAAQPTKSKAKTPKACACGCEAMTKGGKWYPGHDGIATGVAVRAIREGRNVEEALAASAANLKAARELVQLAS